MQTIIMSESHIAMAVRHHQIGGYFSSSLGQTSKKQQFKCILYTRQNSLCEEQSRTPHESGPLIWFLIERYNNHNGQISKHFSTRVSRINYVI